MAGKTSNDPLDKCFDLGGNIAANYLGALKRGGKTLSREELGVLASGFITATALIYAEQAAAAGECPNCAKIDFFTIASECMARCASLVAGEAPEHGKAH